MKKKPVLYSELCYVIGVILLAIGTAFNARGDFGVSAIVAPAYILHLKFSQTYEWFTFGKAEYLVQFLLLILTCILVRRFKWSFLLSFVTALIYGFFLDIFVDLVALLPMEGIAMRLVFYIGGFFIAVVAIAFLFNTYFSPEVYELLVREVAKHYKLPLGKVKVPYDYTSMLVALILCFAFFGFGNFVGIKLGTLLTVLVNGIFIAWTAKFIQTHFEIKDALKLRKYFEIKEEDA